MYFSIRIRPRISIKFSSRINKPGPDRVTVAQMAGRAPHNLRDAGLNPASGSHETAILSLTHIDGYVIAKNS